jgi:hypothetical protein
MPYIPPDYLDNTPNLNLGTALIRLMLDWEQRELDVATGYFDPKIWEILHESLPTLTQFRLLLGSEPDLEGKGPGDEIELQSYFRQRLRGDLEQLPFDPKWAGIVAGLTNFLQGDTVAVRLYPSFLHAKAYLFPQVAIVGSSNFTRAGLNRKAELNLVHKSDMVAAKLRRDWFEPFWNEAKDYKAALIAALQESKFGKTLYTPFHVFIKVLYEYFRERLSAIGDERYGGISLASFQREGLAEAIRLLNLYKGVLVADAVGLGKTYIGMGLLEHYLLGQRKQGNIPRGLIVCPAQLRDLVWLPKLDEYSLKAQVLSMEEMGRADFDWQRYNGYDFILVDESHNFRNPNTGRYQNLIKLIATGKADKMVALMTATPINNSIWDLYHQTMLLTRGSDTYFRERSIPNLRGFFKRVSEGSAELFDLLELTTVRRSRWDIKKRQEAGEVITLPGKGEIRFPNRQLERISYNLEQAYRGFYDEIANQIENLSLVSYNIAEYLYNADAQQQKDVKRNNALIGIMKTTLLKRLESSWYAFAESIQRQRNFQERFLQYLQAGKLLDSASNRKMLAIERMINGEEDEPNEDIEALIVNLPEVSANDYDLAAIQEGVASDLKIFDEILEWVEIVRQSNTGEGAHDAKLDAVKDELANALRDQKVLLFSYYQDTARYIYDRLRGDEAWLKAAGHPVLGLIDGGVSGHEREQRVKQFAPVANTANTDEGIRERDQLQQNPIQILICTDVLSEGQNLQDAGVLINYDLHWNPVRMIQRAGRIDRLGSPHEVLSIYNCFPEDGLESLLQLVARLQRRIRDIDNTIGLDASVLGEIIHPRSLDELRKIKQGEQDILDELERQGELVSTDEMKLPLIAYLQAMGEQRLREIPLGIHSGKRSARPGTFFAFRAKERHFWRFYPAEGGNAITDKRQIFQMIIAKEDTPRIVPRHDIFPSLQRATDEIMGEIESLRTVAQIPPRLRGWNLEFYNGLSQPTLFDAVPEELQNRLIQALRHTELAPFQRDPALKRIRQDYRQQQNPRLLAEQLDAYFVTNDLYREIIEPHLAEEIQREDLELICYELLQ